MAPPLDERGIIEAGEWAGFNSSVGVVICCSYCPFLFCVCARVCFIFNFFTFFTFTFLRSCTLLMTNRVSLAEPKLGSNEPPFLYVLFLTILLPLSLLFSSTSSCSFTSLSSSSSFSCSCSSSCFSSFSYSSSSCSFSVSLLNDAPSGLSQASCNGFITGRVAGLAYWLSVPLAKQPIG